jgi:hypothetical protein
MSKGHAAAALLSAPKEAEAAERPLSILRTKSGVLEGRPLHNSIFIHVVRVDCPSTDHAVINARRANRKIDILFLGQVICSGHFGDSA